MKLRDAWAGWVPAWQETHPFTKTVHIGTKPYIVQKLNSKEVISWFSVCRPNSGSLSPGKLGAWQAKTFMMTQFHTMIVRDGIPWKAAHDAFLVIDEYRWLISRDIEGAEDDPAA